MNAIETLIVEQVENLNQILNEPLDLSQGTKTVLFGEDNGLESVDFVSLILDIEQAAQETFGKPISLTDARAMSQRNSPFRTVESLAAYIHELLQEETNA